ncbi:hypothetical protein AVDCRST_MAG82-1728 [uncultured Rubrobacteraceae bacterium]|uniref:Uncharacterized protein n=1 Tax=uncultured Rubrobacteraceae bacterium TaxID=349277 RepID=A0A6J4PTZ9_9ACTN|nr:hypothetical protein AVDCRST_MAG82-1728 [uncultured Rubrobacteraceae bacterium]
MPAEGEPGHREMLEELERLFRRHEEGGRLTIEHATQVYYGSLAL